MLAFVLLFLKVFPFDFYRQSNSKKEFKSLDQSLSFPFLESASQLTAKL